MTSPRETLKKAAGNKGGILTLRQPMGAAGEPYRRMFRMIEELVQAGLLAWANPQRTMVRITAAGRRSLKD